MSEATKTDTARLQELGYDQQLRRGLGFFSTFSIGVATVAPVVGLYAIFSLGLTLSGPVWIWLLLASLVGQFLVAVIYAELASEFPVAGGPFHWTKNLVGMGFGLFTGLIYLVAVSAALATVAFLAAPWFGALFGLSLSPSSSIATSFGLLMAALVINACGVRIVGMVVNAGIAAEIIASVLVGLTLLVFFRQHDLGILFDPMGTSASLGTIMATLAVCGWAFVGFDASASVAEESQGAGITVPRAIAGATAIVGVVVILVAVGVMLATPDLAAVIAGSELDPVTATVVASLGPWSELPFLAIVAVTFFACIVSMQAYLGRVVFGLARDRAVPLSGLLSRVSPATKVPLAAMAAMTFVASACLLLGLDAGAIGSMITFGTAGLYMTFLLVVAAALFGRLSGRWKPSGSLRLGRWGLPINVLAFLWLVVETANIFWPRAELAPVNASFLQVWAAVLVFAVTAIVAIIYILIRRQAA